MRTLLVRFNAGLTLALLISLATSVFAAPVKLNGALPVNGSVYDVHLSPEGSHILYYADQDTQGVLELYIVPVGGGPSLKLNDAFVPGGTAHSIDVAFTPDGSKVLYAAEQDTDDVVNLYVVPSIGGSALKLNGALDLSLSPDDIVLSHDGSRVLYTAYQGIGYQELFVVETGGGDPIKLNSPFPVGAGLGFNDSQFSPDDSQVLFASDMETPDVEELFIVPVEGGTPLKLNGPLAPGAGINSRDVQFTADGSHVLYRAQVTADVNELFLVPSAGGTPLKLNGSLIPGGSVGSDYVQSPDGSDVLYIADQDTDGELELYITPLVGGTSLKLNGPLWPTGDVDDDGLQFSPDGNQVLFVAEVSGVSTQELFIVPRTGGTPIKLNGELVPGGDIVATTRAIQFTEDGSHVFYVADQEVDGRFELYVVPATGGTAAKLNGPLAQGGIVNSHLEQSPDGERLLYRAEQENDEIREIYIVPVLGGTPVKVSGSLAPGVQADGNFEFTPDGSRVIYKTFDELGNGELYSRVVRQHMTAAQGHWSSQESWEHGEVPDEVMHVIINSPSVLRGGTETAVGMIDLGGGAGTSTIQLDGEDAITTINRLAIHNRGVLTGGGRVNGDVVVEPGGEIRVAGRRGLQVSGNTFQNSGRVEALGTSFEPAEIEFDALVTNHAGTGLITGSHARLRFDEGLTNQGSLVLSLGESHVFGDIVNTGRIVVTGGAAVTFYDDIVQNGILTISKVGSTSSAAIFLGDVSGSGTMGGGGDVFLEGDLRPGNSPGTISFDNNIFLGAATNVDIEIGGMTAGAQFDTIAVDGEFVLDGVLNVSLIDASSGAFLPEGGSEFEIINASGGIGGQFADSHLPGPRGGISFGLAYSNESVSILVAGARGDYNYDGTVDSADYVLWRKLAGTTAASADGNGDGFVNAADLQVWQSRLGNAAVDFSQFGAGANVPEPHAIGLLLMACTVFSARRRSGRTQ